MQIYIASKVASESKAPLDSEGCLYVLQATENKVVFKWDLKVASEDAERRSVSRKFLAKVTAMEKVLDAK